MRVPKVIENWFDIRPKETQRAAICILGAFFLLAYVILARSIREGLFLAVFDATNLPYITAAVACLSLPVVGIFADLLSRLRLWMVLQRLMIIIGAGLAILWAVSAYIQAMTVAFYIWTILGAMLLTSGFWVLVAECFAVRSAKRLFGLIAAGGTAGAMTMGLSLSWITLKLELTQLIPLLIGLLAILYLIELRIHNLSQNWQQTGGGNNESTADNRYIASPNRNGESSNRIFHIGENLGALWKSPYLEVIASVVFIATVSGNIVDYQLKEYAQASIAGGENLTAFLGSFYGWTGGIALIIQLICTARIMASAGVALGLAILPGLLLLGSSAFLIIPGLMMATLVRGSDNALRKSLLRPMLEFLYVPVPSAVRRKTKLFIDSFVDSAAEGTGAAMVFIWVVMAGGQSRYLSIPVIVLSLIMLVLSRRLGKRYLDTIVSRLKEGDAAIGSLEEPAGLRNIHLLTASYSKIDLQTIMMGAGGSDWPETGGYSAPQMGNDSRDEATSRGEEASNKLAIVSFLKSPDDAVVLNALENTENWDEDHIPLLIRLLARDNLQRLAARSLLRVGRASIPNLDVLLRDENADFVIRRRIPGVLAGMEGMAVENALFGALSARRFEIRYRTVVALARLKKKGFSMPQDRWKPLVWSAIRREVNYNRPVWEMRVLLDSLESSETDGLVEKRVENRCGLSLEHTFRMLTLVLESKPVAAALHGIILNHEELKGFALEYLENTLPADIRKKLWFLIGDIGQYRRAKQSRPIQQVVSDLMQSRATLFQGELDRKELKKILEKRDE